MKNSPTITLTELLADISTTKSEIASAKTKAKRDILNKKLSKLNALLKQVEQQPSDTPPQQPIEQHPIDKQLYHMLRGDFKTGREICEQLEAAGPDNIPQVPSIDKDMLWLRHCFNRGWFLLNQGDFIGGHKLLESGRPLKVYGSAVAPENVPEWRGEDINGKTIAIILEGGFGDEVIYARFATTLAQKGAKVILVATEGIHGLFSRIEGVDQVVTRKKLDEMQYDYWVPGFSVGWIAGVEYSTLQSTPYLSAQPALVEKWKEKIEANVKPGQLKVGIRWAGNPRYAHQEFRKFPPHLLHDLANNEQLRVFSLQRDEDILALPSNIVDLQHSLTNWEETAAAIMNLDLVISSCTSIAHVASALGKRTWVMIPVLPYHTWAYGAPEDSSTPWYQSTTLFRQEAFCEWTSAFNKMYEALETEFKLATPIPRVTETTEHKVLNLGSGFSKEKGAINVDSQAKASPDVLHDLNNIPYPFEDNTFNSILAKNILEYLGNDSVSFSDVIKELYRISKPGATWRVRFPHHRSDKSVNDPSRVRVLTPASFTIYDQLQNVKMVQSAGTDSPLGIYNDVDIEVLTTELFLTPAWEAQKNKDKISDEEIMSNIDQLNNVCEYVVLLIRVHKPGRYPTD